MATTLVTRPCDPAAAKVVLSAMVSGSLSALKIVEPSKSKKLTDEDYAPFSSRTVSLLLESGTVLSDVNAMARYMYGMGGINISLSEETWIEWEESVLRPAVYGRDAGAVASALEALERETAGGTAYLSRDSESPDLSLADVVVGCTLRAGVLLGVVDANHNTAYYKRFMDDARVAGAIEAVGLFKGADEAEAAAVARMDAAEQTARAPKLPGEGHSKPSHPRGEGRFEILFPIALAAHISRIGARQHRQ